MSKTRVFVDTNIIIEAFRTGCWTQICRKFSMETVEKCIEEALAGDPLEPNRIPVDKDPLISGLGAAHAVGKLELACLALGYPDLPALDDGELHLLAWLHAKGLLPEALVLISTADKAAVVATCQLGGMDSLASLEHLMKKSGGQHEQINNLRKHYRASWLDEIKTKIRLGVIP
ncbi:hypothetical protein Dalk_3714 [Desulfatibacillum aliphaticivorans]|uniref:PIN domain-containing protein n=1 Tax=Desulfatibacillum aliphaticivorans TaxID=218208 RepID=B8FLP8_DESAL|nr:hypothetical protein [Desulfatibacillum aliphaticivorans]ACL05402.1 hypothetical protein Dalk_3714 [Desulfatibacillum aliphaticivorans]